MMNKIRFNVHTVINILSQKTQTFARTVVTNLFSVHSVEKYTDQTLLFVQQQVKGYTSALIVVERIKKAPDSAQLRGNCFSY